MTQNALKERIVKEFESAGLIKCLELEESGFRELPGFFEVSHLAICLTLNDVAALAGAGSIAAKLKSDLHQEGIELDYAIRVQWAVSGFSPDCLQCDERDGLMPAEYFHVEVQSGSVQLLTAIRVSEDARKLIRRHLADLPVHEQRSEIYDLLETYLNEQLANTGIGHWDPVLYSNRTVEAEGLAQIMQSMVADQV